MSNNCNTIASILLRGGTDRMQRAAGKLTPDSIQLHGFGLEEWMKFAYNFADSVKFFDAESGMEDGTWKAFFKDEEATKQLLNDLERSNELTPHLTLFVCFLRLLQFSTKRLNDVTKRHLDFFYQEVLQIEKLPSSYDKVNVVFELSKNIVQTNLDAGTKLNAGKDENGIQRFYELSEETSLNAAKLTSFKSFYFDPDFVNPASGETISQNYMKAASVANSLDGEGEEPLSEEQTTWYGFGYNHTRVGSAFSELPDAKIGFAVTSHVLSLSEGIRHVQLKIQFSQSIENYTFEELSKLIEVQYTKEKGWSDAIRVEQTSEGTKRPYVTGVNTANRTISLYVKLDRKQDAAGNYNREIHGEQFTTEHPVFRCLLKTNSEEGLRAYRTFIKNISKIEIEVEASGIRKLKLENDRGTLNPDRPVYPFTNIPVDGSSFSVYSEEVFSKKWNAIYVDVTWKNAPANFVNWYDSYKEIYESNFQPVVFRGPNKSQTETSEKVYQKSILAPVVGSNLHFKGTRAINLDGAWTKIPGNVNLFQGASPFETSFSINGAGYTGDNVEGIRLSLNQSFLHEMYPKLYAAALTDTSGNTTLPNEPYTPLTEDISVTYTANDTINLSSEIKEEFEKRENDFYHETIFGQALQHSYEKSQLDFLRSNACSLVPSHCRGGELFIGIDDAENLQNVSMLIQLLEGSENKQTSSFLGTQGVKWEILCKNHWKELDTTLLVKNATDNFLQTGIVEFKIPREATQDNTLLPSGQFWIKASMHKSFDAVCQIVNIHSQVSLAEFVNNGNELSHLGTGLEAETITKLSERSAKIKKVIQPYNSFGGSPQEKDDLYYQRVSERIRHKNRAITLWDYEHIVLQEFSDLYRVKCLNHTSADSFTAAGHVTLIVIPDTVKKNVFNRFQPRVSTAYLNRIKELVSKRNSLHVQFNVENPSYEEVEISLKVKFHKTLDESVYKVRLNEDIVRFLSPWAFDESQQVDFGRSLHVSILINYIEKLDYVDYLQDVSMSIDGGSAVKEYIPSTPRAIMVSKTKHSISTNIITCESITETITEECQQ